MQSDLALLTACDLAPRLRTGELSVEALARSCLARIEARDPQVRAWTYVDGDRVLAQARELDGCTARGPLHGLPVGVKDVILTKDMPTQHNSPIYQGSHPAIDAACVQLLRAAGALIFGKTDTVEFAATGRKALTRNPRDPDLQRTPGGSSSGSAAAVADFHVPLALGTQTGGSMIRPASFCGVFAMKPTWNLVSNEGARRFAPTLDTIGWFARSTADLALLYQVLDPEQAPVPDIPIDRLRIGLCRSAAWDHAEEATQGVFAAAARKLQKAGADVQPLELPAAFDGLIEQQLLIMRAEGRSSFLPEYRAHYALLHESLREQVDNTARITREDLRRAYDAAAQRRAEFDHLAAQFDAVLTPSAVGEAPVGLADTGSFVFNAMWTLLHAPCVNVPGFAGPHGMPVGVTLVGPRFGDRRVLAAASGLERVLAA